MCGAGLLDVYAALMTLAPIIHIASVDQVVVPGTIVMLDASAFSSSGSEVMSYTWQASASNKIPITISGADTAHASFIAPATGVYQFVVVVKDSSGSTSNASASVRVNTAPEVQTVTTRQVSAGGALTIKLQALDIDGDKPVFHALLLPDGASLNAAGVFTWSRASPVGTHTISVAASDNYASSSPLNFTVEVVQSSTATATASISGGSGGGGSMEAEWLLAMAGLLIIGKRRRARPD